MPSPLSVKLAALAAILQAGAVSSQLSPQLVSEFAAASLDILGDVVAAVDGLGEPERAALALGLESASRRLAELKPAVAELEAKHGTLAAAVADLAARLEQLRAEQQLKAATS